MPNSIELKKITAEPFWQPAVASDALTVKPLMDDDEAEVLDFLVRRPVHTVIMTGFILDNGMESPFNRGTFYGCRDARGALEGVALIGHATLIETRSDTALATFARLAQACENVYMLMGEQDKIENFWSTYERAGREPRLVCRELLFEQRVTPPARPPVPGLRLATLDDLKYVLPVHARLAYAESGVNPLEVDPDGFRLRCSRRIAQERVWVWVEDERLIFKVDVVAETPQATYLEGLHIHTEERGKGYGLRCMTELAHTLCKRTKAICVLINEQNLGEQTFIRKAGYELRSSYETIFLQPSREHDDVARCLQR